MAQPKPELNIRFGKLLQRHRKAAGFDTQAAFAAKAEISLSAVTQYESGSADPSFKMMIHLASILNIDPAELLWDLKVERNFRSRIIFEINSLLTQASDEILSKIRDIISAMLKK